MASSRYLLRACYSPNVRTRLHLDHVSTHIHSPSAPPDNASNSNQPLQDRFPLRPLTTLKWPYIPDTSAYPDPLTRDDPKPLQMHQYEAIATSPTIRTLLSNPCLCTLLTAIDALQHALCVDSRLPRTTMMRAR
ncbi:hypothetical protein OG21DRAFT_1486851 [Imleria badia]|nr:hypothetical protein OG21DRAFT_1486851 [Imleria badia]